MPGKDGERWKKNEDGSWSRKNAQGDEETTAYNPNATSGALETALELGIDINTVEGSGKDGKVTKADVDAAHAEASESVV